MTAIKEITYNHHHQNTDNFLLNGVGNPETTSKKYRAAASQDLIDCFKGVGYSVRNISKPQARNAENLPYNKHIIRLTKDVDALSTLAQDYPEIVIVNNSNNRGSLQVLLGIYRLVCLNGMILGDNFFSSKVRHSKEFYNNLFFALQKADENYLKVNALIDQLKGIELDQKTVLDYRAHIVEHVLRPKLSTPTTQKLEINCNFNPRRKADLERDAWTVFNRYQEYVIRGGVGYKKIDQVTNKETGKTELKLINSTTRKISGVDSKVKLNQSIMNETMNFFNIAM